MRVLFAALTLALLVPDRITAQRDNFFESNGIRIRYVEQGTGEPIILLHAQTSSIENGWIVTGVFAELGKDHRVIAMDVRGHGRSDKPHEAGAYGEELARDVVRLLDHLNIQRAHIVGYSMGGAINAKLLTQRPERYLTAVLGGSTGLRRWASADQDRWDRVAVELAGDMPFVNLLRGALRGQTEEQIAERAAWVRANNDPLAIGAALRGQGGLLVTTEQLAATRVPVMAIVGTADPVVADVRQLKARMPQLKVVEIPGAVHHAFEPQSAPRRPEFSDAIRAFARENRGTQFGPR